MTQCRSIVAEHGGGLDVGGIGANFRLAQAERGELFTAGERGEIAGFLFFGAHEHQGLQADRLMRADQHGCRAHSAPRSFPAHGSRRCG